MSYDPDPPFELTPTLRDSLRVFSVYVPGKVRPRKVVALYFRVEDGTLVFRIPNPNGGYPYMVAMFAPGMWREVR